MGWYNCCCHNIPPKICTDCNNFCDTPFLYDDVTCTVTISENPSEAWWNMITGVNTLTGNNSAAACTFTKDFDCSGTAWRMYFETVSGSYGGGNVRIRVVEIPSFDNNSVLFTDTNSLPEDCSNLTGSTTVDASGFPLNCDGTGSATSTTTTVEYSFSYSQASVVIFGGDDLSANQNGAGGTITTGVNDQSAGAVVAGGDGSQCVNFTVSSSEAAAAYIDLQATLMSGGLYNVFVRTRGVQYYPTDSYFPQIHFTSTTTYPGRVGRVFRQSTSIGEPYSSTGDQRKNVNGDAYIPVGTVTEGSSNRYFWLMGNTGSSDNVLVDGIAFVQCE